MIIMNNQQPKQVKLETFDELLNKFGEVGYVSEVNGCIVKIEGLPKASVLEVVLFEGDGIGYVTGISHSSLEVLLLEDAPPRIGIRVARSGRKLDISLSPQIIGLRVDSLARVAGEPLKNGTSKTVFSAPPKLTSRAEITQPFESGVSLVDMVVPLAKGQRELVIGDRKTGKTQFLKEVMLNLKGSNTICVYAAIGNPESEIAHIYEFLEKSDISKKCVFVEASAHASVGMIFLTPFTAMAIAEYLRDLGNDVLVILDDLTTHAGHYREMSLLSRRFPGRNSYPGDIFHIHAELLERAGSFILNDKTTKTITCLAVAQSVLGDVSSYLSTNLMSMTDGHIYFDVDYYDEGYRPAINPFLSVTRVGHQTQSPILRDISREALGLLMRYRKSLQYSHFGSEVSSEMRNILNLGVQLNAFFHQEGATTRPHLVTVFVTTLIFSGVYRGHTEQAIKERTNDLILLSLHNPAFLKQVSDILNSSKTLADCVLAFKNLDSSITK